MTIKVKIILGFILLMAITVIASTIGYNGFNIATDNLKNFQRFAEADTLGSDFTANLLGASRKLVMFMKDADEEDAKDEAVFIKKAQENIDELATKLINPSIVEEVKKAQAEMQSFGALLSELTELARQADHIYRNTVRPSATLIMDSLSNLDDAAVDIGNITALKYTTDAWYNLTSLLAATARYNVSYAKEDKDLALQRLEGIERELKKLGTVVSSEKGAKLYSASHSAMNAINKAVLTMFECGDHLGPKYKELRALQAVLFKRAAVIDAYASEQSENLFSAAIKANSAGQTQLFTSSAVGIAIGIILALVIIISLIRVLNDLSAFASAIARGDFTYIVKTKEKGEIGRMVSGIQQIPAVLQELINGTIAGVKKMQVGHFKSRLDSKAYNGSYAELVNAVNTVADTYTKILDGMPVPLLTANKNNKVHYSNNASEEALQGNLLESYVTEGESNFGINAISRGTSVTAETTFIKDGKSRTMAVTAVPLNDYDGNPAAFIEILTDLTDIKEQQRVMLQVAEEATEIATRVAAASEEIAAQVEQVSRGADVQRSRVESTASAMTEMNATVIEVARSASEAAEQSDNTRSKAEDGSELVNSVMKSINQVNAVSQNLHSNMQELGTQAESIGNVMNVISDIADQTNLLALNAAIEAARAGEAGRGFAVVADEVRKLAEKTMQATQEVGSSISAVQQSARVNIDEVSKAVTAVEEANQLANSSGEALSEIVNLASANSNVVNSIATAAEEQSATSSEISNALTEINTIVGETTEGMVQSSAAIQDLSSMAQDLQRVMSGLR